MLLELVPDKETFRLVLRFIRIWAKKRFVYGNVFGYLGGVNLAILSAFICQRYPTRSAAYLILMFFHDLAKWPWPEPIYINTPSTGNRPNWDPTKPQDHRDVMPIITPAYPTINSLRSATRSSRMRMMHEFKHAFNVCSQIIKSASLWDPLISPPTFFVRHNKFVEITVFGTTEEAQREFVGFVQSRMRHITVALEIIHQIKYAYVFPNEFKTPGYRGHEFCSTYFIALTFNKIKEENLNKAIDLSGAAKTWATEVRAKAPENADVDINLVDNKDLPSFVFPNGERPEIKTRVKVPAEPVEEE